MTQQVLFLCTGNYYRSRFAELLFNALAEQRGLPWRAQSRGVACELGINNTGPMSPYTVQALEERGIDVTRHLRSPLQLQPAELEQAGLIIALDETEHRPFIQERFRHWAARVEYWQVADADRLSTADALARIEQQVQRLVERLASEPATGA